MTLATLYRERHYVVIDGFLPSATCQTAQEECKREHSLGGLELSTVYEWDDTSKAAGQVSVAVPDRRSDLIKYLADEETRTEHWSSVRSAVDAVDALTRRLRELVPEELGEVAARTRPMLSAYREGAKFERHCDNHCEDEHEHTGAEHASEAERDEYDGGCANRRRLSAVLYLVPAAWAASDGGALRLYRPTAETHGGWDGDDAMVDVLPRPARLVLFASDQRVPHEVLPVVTSNTVRYALALWYLAPPPAAAEKRREHGERPSDTSVIPELRMR